MNDRTQIHIDAHLRKHATVIGKHYLSADYSTHVLQFDGITLYIEAEDYDIFTAKLMLALSMSASDAQDNHRKATMAKTVQAGIVHQEEPDCCLCDSENICESCQKAMAEDYASNPARE